MIKGSAFFCLFCLSGILHASEEPRWVNRTDYKISEYWVNSADKGIPFRYIFEYFRDVPDPSCMGKVLGNAWHSIVASSLWKDRKPVPGTEEIAKLPLFRDSWLYFHAYPKTDFRKIGKGEEMIRMDQFLNPEIRCVIEQAEKAGRRYTIDARTREQLHLFDNQYRCDMEEYTAWKRKHPHFLAFTVGEWCNDYLTLMPTKFDRAKKAGLVTQQEYETGLAKYKLPGTAAGIVKHYHWIFNTLQKYIYQSPQDMLLMHAFWNMGHVAGANGAKQIYLEVTNTTGQSYMAYRWQDALYFMRGAARQFGMRWSWYQASYFNGYDSKGKFVLDSQYGWNPFRDPWGGMSRSLVLRGQYLGWLSGAFMLHNESATGTFVKQDGEGRYSLTPYGEDAARLYDLTQKHDRGISYAPIALLTPYEMVQTVSGGNAWSYTAEYPLSLRMLDAFMATILPGYERPEKLREGNEGCLFNSPYGDVFDVLNPDAPVTNPLQILPAYKAAVLIGDYKENPVMAEKLMQYVKDGGTLILNITQLSGMFPESFTGIKRAGIKFSSGSYTLEKITLLDDARIVAKDASGNPLLTLHPVGYGNLIVCTAEYMLPNAEILTMNEILSGTIKFDLIETVLKRLLDETLPVRVEGNIQYGINSLSDGYLIYLINNNGVKKFTDKQEILDPAASAKVTVFLKDGILKTATELVSGNSLEISGNAISATVSPGGIAIVKLIKQK